MMGDPADQQEQPPAKRGEAAWKEHMQRIAARNDQARKAGKARRQAAEREKDKVRWERERREMADLVERSKR